MAHESNEPSYPHPSDTVTIPVRLFDAMAKVYYGRQVPRPDTTPPETPTREHKPQQVAAGDVSLRGVEVLLGQVPKGYEPRGILQVPATPEKVETA